MESNLQLLAAEFMKAIPNIVGALLVLLIGYMVAKAVKSLVKGVLMKTGLNKTVSSSSAGSLVNKVTTNPAAVIATLAFWAVYLGAISLAVSVLGISALTAMVAAVYSYLPNVIAAVLILLVAAAVSAAVSGLVAKVMGDTATGKMVAGIVPGVIFSIAIFMALNQLQIATEIVTITYAAIIGSVALGAALAFGLGGRDVAAQMLQQAQFKAQEHAAQVRQDLATGKERSRAMASDAKQSLQGQEQAEEQPQAHPGFMPAPGFGESTESFKDLPPKKRP